jgi:hypothetical protein
MKHTEECNRELFSNSFIAISKYPHIYFELPSRVIFEMKLFLHHVPKFYSEHRFSLIHQRGVPRKSDLFANNHTTPNLLATPYRIPHSNTRSQSPVSINALVRTLDCSRSPRRLAVKHTVLGRDSDQQIPGWIGRNAESLGHQFRDKKSSITV